MKNLLLSFIMVWCASLISQAQVSVNTDNSDPDPAAMLDVKSTDKGMLIPRVALVSTTDPISINKPNGLLVWNTSTTGNYPEPGFYYWDGSDWVKISTGSGPSGSYEIVDSDNDTRITVEYSTDEDTIRFFVAGNEVMKHDGKTLHILNAYNNIFVGERAGESNTSGESNQAIGKEALLSNTTGKYNIAIGDQALRDNTEGDRNIAIGRGAISFGWDDQNNDNVAIGDGALQSGSGSIAIGRSALSSNYAPASNIGIGSSALRNNDYGTDNIGIGGNALYYNFTGNFNIGIGNNSNYANGYGSENTIIGYWAGGRNLNHSKSGSVFLGYKSGYYEITSNKLYIENTDADSLNALIYGDFANDKLVLNGNVGIGVIDPSTELEVNGDITANNFYGNMIVNELADDDQDTRITVEYVTDEDTIRFFVAGNEVMKHDGKTLHITDAYNNVFIGNHAGEANVDGTFNLAFGGEALKDNTIGDSNIAIGGEALEQNTAGNGNIAVGNRALFKNDNGFGNTALGSQAGYQNISGDNNVFLGKFAGYNETGNNKLYIENSQALSEDALIFGDFDAEILAFDASVGIGTITPTAELEVNGTVVADDFIGDVHAIDISDSDEDTRITVENSPDEDTIRFFVAGAEVMKHDGKTLHTLNDKESVYIGLGAGTNSQAGAWQNTFVGHLSGNANTSGHGNTFVGNGAGESNDSGELNSFFGIASGESNILGNFNSFFGSGSGMDNDNGSSNSFFGQGSGSHNINGSRNSFFGTSSGWHHVSGDENSFFGRASGYKLISGSQNTLIGSQSGYFNQIGSGNVFIGFKAGFDEQSSNKLYIENTDADSLNALIYGDFLNDKLVLNANVGIGTIDPTAELEVNGDIKANNFIGNVHAQEISDTDADTRITVENSPDEDTIRFFVAGTEVMKHDGKTLHITEPDQNIFIGKNAGVSNSTGNSSIAIGNYSLHNNSERSGLVALGDSALFNNGPGATDPWEATGNTAIGSNVLFTNTTGYYNTANGLKSGYFNTSGNRNSFFGFKSGFFNTSGAMNSFLGYKSGYSNTLGNFNSFLGYKSGYSNKEGQYNLFLGTYSGYSDSIGDFNVFIGNRSGYYETSSNKLYIENSDADSLNALIYGDFANDKLVLNGKVGIGTISPTAELEVNGTVVANDFIGEVHAIDISDSDEDTRITVENSPDEDTIRFFVAGTEVLKFDGKTIHMLNNGSCVFIGKDAGINSELTNNGNTAIGGSSMYSNTVGTINTAIGFQSLYSNISGQQNTAVGWNSLYSNTTGVGNTALGSNSLKSNSIGWSNTAIGSSTLFQNTEGGSNTAIGTNALYSNTTGSENTAIGSATLSNNTIGFYNTAVGRLAISSNDSGNYNTALGHAVLYSNINGSYNVGIGANALSGNTIGINNVAIGMQALSSNTSGNYNIANGREALHSNSTGNNNIAIGYRANERNSTGSDNVIIGHEAGRGGVGDSKSGCIMIGYQAGRYEYGDNKLYIENSDNHANQALIYGDFDSDKLTFNGLVGIHTLSPATELDVNGQIRSRNLGIDNTLDSIVVADGNGVLYTRDYSTIRDNLGNHVATQNIDLDGNLLTGDGGIDLGVATGDGIKITQAGSPTTSHASALNNGFEVNGAEGSGLYVGRSEDDGVYIYSAGEDGMQICNAVDHGVQVTTAGGDGVYVNNPADDGFAVYRAGSPSNWHLSSDNNGLEVNGAEGNGVFIGHADEDGVMVWSANDNLFQGGIDGSEVFTVSNTGDVMAAGDLGIGTDSPTHQLDVNGQTRIRSLSEDNTLDSIVVADGNGVLYSRDASTIGDNLGNHTATENIELGSNWLSGDGGSEGIYVSSIGSVGMGTSSPSRRLHVFESNVTAYTGAKIQNGASFGMGGAQLEIETDGNQFNLGVGGGNNVTLGSKFYIYQQSAGARMVIDGSGNVGIGATSPAAKLSNDATLCSDGTKSTSTDGINWRINGGGYALGVENAASGGSGLLVEAGNNSGTGSTVAHFVSNNVSLMYIREDGNVGIGTTSPSQRLTVYNGITTGTYTTAGWIHSSDARLKTNITPVDHALEKVKQLDGVYYQWKDGSGEKQIGLIAQEVEKVLPEVVCQDDEGYYGLSYGGMVPLLIEAVKEQQKTIDELKERIEELEKK